MPSGYTSAIGEDISFEQFVWNCARGMSALIMMRDEPHGAPIPERFEPSDYNAKALQEALTRLEELRAMDDERASTEAAAAYQIEFDAHEKRITDADNLRGKYKAMLTKVEVWCPPSSDHVGLKTFMTEQITGSIDFDCDTDYYRKKGPKKLTGNEWLTREREKALHDVSYHTKAQQDEIDRTESRNVWLAQLRTSVPQPNPAKQPRVAP